MKTKFFFISIFVAIIQLAFIQVFGQLSEIVKSHGEAVYLHTNLPQYLAGESISFKAYIPEDYIQSVAVEDSLIVAVLDMEGLEVANGIYQVQNGQLARTIGLSGFLTDGNYLLIACTGKMKNGSPRDIFSKVVEIKRNEKTEFSTVITLTEESYRPGSLLTSEISFSGKGGSPVSVPYSYYLTGVSGELLSEKRNSGKDGSDVISLQLPVFKDNEKLKLIITASNKGEKINTGIVIPTTYNNNPKPKEPDAGLPVQNKKQLNILVQTSKQQYRQNELIQADIFVTNYNGEPVTANLSVSASNRTFDSSPLPVNDKVSSSVLECNSKWSRFLADSADTISQILNTDLTGNTISESSFNAGFRKLLAGYLSSITQSPGIQFNIQEKNDLKKIKTKKDLRIPQKQMGYSASMSIFDILRQIKPYWLADNKIVFSSSGVTSVNNQDGAIIVVDGINTGTDSRILNTIQVTDIARISASTNPMDIQRFTAMNSVGVIEIYTKKGAEKELAEDKSVKNLPGSLYWVPDIPTNSSGKLSISFLNNKSSPILVTVAGIAAGGLSGTKTIQLSVY